MKVTQKQVVLIEFSAKQLMVAIVAAWQGKVLGSVLYAARMENDVSKEQQEKLAVLGNDIYACLQEKELTLKSERYPRLRDVKWF